MSVVLNQRADLQPICYRGRKLGVGISGAHVHHCVEASNSYRLEAATFRKAKAMQEIYRGQITEGGGKLPIINN